MIDIQLDSNEYQSTTNIANLNKQCIDYQTNLILNTYKIIKNDKSVSVIVYYFSKVYYQKRS